MKIYLKRTNDVKITFGCGLGILKIMLSITGIIWPDQKVPGLIFLLRNIKTYSTFLSTLTDCKLQAHKQFAQFTLYLVFVNDFPNFIENLMVTRYSSMKLTTHKKTFTKTSVLP